MAAAAAKLRAVVSLLCLLLLSGCYVSTHLQVQADRVPQGFSSSKLVIAVSDKVGLAEDQLAELQDEAVRIFTERGVKCTTLYEAVGVPAPERPGELLKQRGYRALLEIVITSWGSRTATLPDLPASSVDSIETSRDSSLYDPGSIEESQYPGPTSSYKEVDMTGSLLDVDSGRVIWAAQVASRPVLVGRSFLYHRFNRGLRYEDMARRCLEKLAGRFPHIRPAAAAASPGRPPQ